MCVRVLAPLCVMHVFQACFVAVFHWSLVGSKKLYVRLFHRNYRWLSLHKVEYPDISTDLCDHVDELIASSLLESGEVLSIHFCANVRILPQYVYCKTTLIFKRKSLVGEEGLTSLCMHYTCNHFGCSLLSACEVCSCSRLRHIHLYPRLGYIGVPITSLSAMHIVTFSVSI